MDLLLIMSMENDYVSELWSLTGLLFIPQIIYEYGELRWNDIDRGKSKNSDKNLFQCHFIYHSFHMDWIGREQTGLCGEELETSQSVSHLVS
jgi:hypothetical protein